MARHRWDPVCDPPRGLVRPVRIDPRGHSGPTRAQAAGPSWRRTARGWYVPADVDDAVPEQRVLEQAVRLPDGGAVTGWAANRLHSASFFDGLESDGRTRIPVPLAVGPGGHVRADTAVRVSREPLPPVDVVARYGIPCVRRERGLFDEMRRPADWREAVVAMDMMAAADLVSISRMLRYLAGHVTWRRSRQVALALRFASELSRSPNETRMRLIWEVDAHLPRPLVNQDVFTHSGRLVGVADLLDPVAGVVGEFDGADHRTGRRQASDVAREEDFRRLGLEYLKVTGPDIPRRSLVARRMLSTRARARFLPEDQRRWTLQPPEDWPVAQSLDQILDHQDLLAAMHGGPGG
jgi:hypothetical protein